ALSGYMAGKQAGIPIYIAPSSTGSNTLQDFSDIWGQLLSAAPSLNTILMQDGVGQRRSSPVVDVLQYGTAMRSVTADYGRAFGLVIEAFVVMNPGESNMTFPPTTIGGLVEQLRIGGGLSTNLYN